CRNVCNRIAATHLLSSMTSHRRDRSALSLRAPGFCATFSRRWVALDNMDLQPADNRYYIKHLRHIALCKLNVSSIDVRRIAGIIQCGIERDPLSYKALRPGMVEELSVRIDDSRAQSRWHSSRARQRSVERRVIAAHASPSIEYVFCRPYNA